ncbi:MAG TPA: hypothetical protein VEV41_24000 [Terriglobales bacterium]|nr:hypothetical protein [Terriglobales bacterium]
MIAAGEAKSPSIGPPSSQAQTQHEIAELKGILRKVNKLASTALRLAAQRKTSLVNEAILLDATAEALL